jgi:hypothetical protein
MFIPPYNGCPVKNLRAEPHSKKNPGYKIFLENLMEITTFWGASPPDCFPK